MLPLFALTLFVSAALLFLIQPMVGKMLLPYLGGTPAVWNTCMVFFQAALLAGYSYAHALTRRLSVRRQIVLHAGLLVLPLVPLALWMLDARRLAQEWPPTDLANPVPWLLAVLAMAVGLPFLVVSTSAPLLQKWFADTGHASAKDPYFLYAASNLGSMLALLAYPTLIEPNLRLAAQAGLWVAGYAVFLALIACCAARVWRSPHADGFTMPNDAHGDAAHVVTPSPSHPVTFWRRLRWVALAFVPSSLMLGVTTYITTDVAPIPLLWVIPLTLYLLSFILAFSRLPWMVHAALVLLLPVLIVLVAFPSQDGIRAAGIPLLYRQWHLIVLHLTTLFVAAMVCHGELARTRPEPRHLTEFYLWVSLGGVLGGLFNALVAPLAFNAVVEYPLVVVIACLLAPRLGLNMERPGLRWLDRGQAAAQWLFGLSVGAFLYVQAMPALFRETAGPFSLEDNADRSSLLLRERSFFGVVRIEDEGHGHLHVLIHGNTRHGEQHFNSAPEEIASTYSASVACPSWEGLWFLAARHATWLDQRRQPLLYFHRNGPIGQVFDTVAERRPQPRVAVLGMGAGTLAGYAEPGWRMTFYEIDPAVVRIAEDPTYFTYLADGRRRGADIRVLLGDGRLGVQQAADATFDLIFMDAFNSDSVPVHLLTREAIDLYFRKLDEGGLLVINIANFYLDFRPILANLARDTGRLALLQEDQGDARIGKYASRWVVLARKQEDLGKLPSYQRETSLQSVFERGPDMRSWRVPPPRTALGVWTDDYSNPLSVFDWDMRSRP